MDKSKAFWKDPVLAPTGEWVRCLPDDSNNYDFQLIEDYRGDKYFVRRDDLSDSRHNYD